MTAPNKTGTSKILKNTRVALSEGKATAKDLLVKGEKYKVDKLIAKGGMAVVFEAKDKNCRRKVALKVIRDSHSKHPEVIHRFIEEAQIAAQLDHPNILPIYDLSLDSHEKPFYAMKMVKGFTLEEILQKIRCENKETIEEYPLSRLLQIFVKICEAVQFAASKGVIHRDLKPENIMIGKFGEVFIMDWGIAKILDDNNKENRASESLENIIESIKHDGEFEIATTMQGQILGTPSFMAPEQVYNEDGEIDCRADVFALGGILYNILVLETPHCEMNIKELLRNKIAGKFPTPEKRASQTGHPLNHLPGRKIPPALSAVCQKALSINPDQRYQSAKDLQEDVEAFINGFATQAEGASQMKLVKLLFLRHRRLSFELVLLVTMVILYLALNYYKLQFAQIESETATSFAEEVFERKAKNMDELTKLYKVMSLMQPQALEKIDACMAENDLLKALAITNQFLKVAKSSDFHLKKAEILIKLSRPRSAMETLNEAKDKFPDDTKISEIIESLKP
ncbi:MAG: serine/threonine protein kinase [Lentisphaeraceae bacterium]|nr:serine/threonine protein kinase [Lentisphaeraceae bacterium]